MKHRIVSLMMLLGCLFFSHYVKGEGWITPTAPAFPTLESADIQDGGIYYIRNAHTGQFLTGGNNWATLISETQDMTPQMQVRVIATTETVRGVSMTGYRLQMANDCVFNGFNPDTNEPIVDRHENAGGYICRWNNAEGQKVDDNGYVSTTNLNGISGYVWSLTKQTNGHYCIQTAEGDPLFSTSHLYAKNGWVYCNGWDWENQLPSIYWDFIPVANVSNDFLSQAAAYTDALQAYKYRKQLLSLMNDAQRIISVEAASAVYNDATATSTQLADAINTLKTTMQSHFSDLESNATVATPFNMTDYALTNPDFNSQTKRLDGWTATEWWQYQGATYQNQNGWTTQGEWWYEGAMTSEEMPARIIVDNFAERWTWSWADAVAGIPDGSLSQTIAAGILPQGQYRLECDFIAAQQSGTIQQSDLTGVYLYAKSNNVVVHGDALQSANEHAEHAAFRFSYDGESALELGVMSENANCNWVAVDNFRLYYEGDETTAPETRELQSYALTTNAIVQIHYETTPTASIDMAAIRSLLGTDVPVLYGLSADGELTKSYTLDPNLGFWLSADGKVVDYSNEGTTLGFAFVNDHLDIYQYPDRVQAGNTYTFNCYLVNEVTGYYVTIVNTVNISELTLSEEVLSLTQQEYMGVVADYIPTALSTIDMSAIRQALGTEHFTVYGLDVNNNLTKEYTMNPAPGFWMTAEGKVTNWDSSDNPPVIGYAFVNDHLEFYQKPDAVNVDNSYTFDVLFVDELTGKYAKVSTAVIVLGNVSNRQITYTYNDANMTASVASNQRYDELTNEEISGVVIIPQTIEYNGRKYTVTGIGNGAFQNCENITAVILPNSITIIGERAFDSCSGLTSFTIPASVTSIGIYAFSCCSGLTSISIPNSVTHISFHAFSVTGLSSITIPPSVTSIGYGAFLGCSDLTSITIPNSVTSIGLEAFSWCSSLTSITIPSSVTNIIDNVAFNGCNNLSTITVDEENERYDSRDNCNAIIETATNTLISGCKNTIIPNSVTSIGDKAFSYCGLSTITIPNSVTSIGSSAFSGNSNLNSITIPSSVTSIGSSAFFGCSNLTSVTSLRFTPPTIEANTFSANATLYVPAGCKAAYQADENWNAFGTIEETLIETVGTSDIAVELHVHKNGNTESGSVDIDLDDICTQLACNANDIVLWGWKNATELTNVHNQFWFNNEGFVTSYSSSSAMALGLNRDNEAIEVFQYYNSQVGDEFTAQLLLSNPERTKFYVFNTTLSIIDWPQPVFDGMEDLGTQQFVLQTVPAQNEYATGTSFTIAGWTAGVTPTLYALVTPEDGQQEPKYSDSYTCDPFPGFWLTQDGYRTTWSSDAASTSKWGLAYLQDGTFELYQLPRANQVGDVCHTTLIAVNPNTNQKVTLDITLQFVEEEAPTIPDTDISQLDNALYVETAEVLAGQQFELPIQLKNNVDVAGISLTLDLPVGMTLAEDEDGDIIYSLNESRDKSSKFSVYWAEDNDGNFGFRIMPNSTTTVSGTEGTVLTVTVNVADGMAEGEYPIILKSNSLTVKDNADQLSTLDLADTRTTFSVIDVAPGDANGDGRIDLTDAIMIVYYSLGQTQTGFVEKAADINSDNRIDLTDAITVVYQSLGVNTQQHAPARRLDPQ